MTIGIDNTTTQTTTITHIISEGHHGAGGDVIIGIVRLLPPAVLSSPGVVVCGDVLTLLTMREGRRGDEGGE